MGETDPRAFAALLKEAGLSYFLDVEMLGNGGLFEQLCAGLQDSECVICCISPEYASSRNCQRELTFATTSLYLPVVPVIVGCGTFQEATVNAVGFILGNPVYIDMTKGVKPEELLKRVRDVL